MIERSIPLFIEGKESRIHKYGQNSIGISFFLWALSLERPLFQDIFAYVFHRKSLVMPEAMGASCFLAFPPPSSAPTLPKVI